MTSSYTRDTNPLEQYTVVGRFKPGPTPIVLFGVLQQPPKEHIAAAARLGHRIFEYWGLTGAFGTSSIEHGPGIILRKGGVVDMQKIPSSKYFTTYDQAVEMYRISQFRFREEQDNFKLRKGELALEAIESGLRHNIDIGVDASRVVRPRGAELLTHYLKLDAAAATAALDAICTERRQEKQTVRFDRRGGVEDLLRAGKFRR